MRFAKYFLALWLAVIFCVGSVHVADATVSTTTTINTYTANGTQTVFPFTYQVLTDANGYPQTSTIAVYLNNVLQNSGYTVSANANQTTSPGGSVTFLTAPAAATTVTIQRATPLLQTYAPAIESKLSVPALTTVLDKLIMISQETGYQASLKLGIPNNAALGSVLVVNPAGAVDVVAPIHAGYVLTDNGPGQKPSFQASTSGAGGNISGPGSSTDYAIPLWNGTAGTNLRGGIVSSTHVGYVLTDNGTGVAPTFQAAILAGPGSTTNYGLALWNGTTGTLLRDGGSLGSAGQKLVSNGAGVAPTFQTDKTNVFGISRVPFRRAMWWQTTNDADTTLDAFGGSALTVHGAGAAANIANQGKYVKFTSSGTTGSVAGVISPTIDETRADYGPILATDIYTDPSSVASQRTWIGLFDIAPYGSDTPAALNAAAFRYSTGASDTTWKCVTSNAGTMTIVDSNVTVVANTGYRMLIDLSTSGHAIFWINEVKVADITTNIPGAVGMGPGITATTLQNAATHIQSSVLYLDTQ